MKKRGKKAQNVFGMSFGVIFSIILIIFFVVVAFFVINSFLKTKKCAQIGLFVDGFKDEIKSAWNSQGSSFEFSSSLPTNIDYVCFVNFSNSFNGKYKNIGEDISIYESTGANLFFYPIKNSCEMPYHTIEHLNLNEITSLKNPYCVAVDKGKIIINIEKKLNKNLVGLK